MTIMSHFVEADLWTLLVKQTIQVTLLISLISFVVAVFGKHRPRLVHALWALVLVKCLTPPIVASPVSLFGSLSATFAPEVVTTVQSESSSAKGDQAREEGWQRTVSQQYQKASQVEDRQVTNTRSSAWKLGDLSKDDSTDRLAAQPGQRDASLPTATWLTHWCVWAWMIGAAISLLIAVARFCRFRREIGRGARQPQDMTTALLETTRTEMGLTGKRFQRVRLKVVDCSIGPAVIGFWRPTILLPRVLEISCSPSELRMLLAHELTHIRRSDLSWALIELLAKSCWWFHPLVRWACRSFDRTTEQNCDEETIARLRCGPAQYARGLLMVLERKHRLRAAPMLPGVRPVELTSNRMERIMKLKNCNPTKRRRWMLALWLLAAALVLPGADWINAQGADGDSKKATNLPAPWKAVEHESAEAIQDADVKAEEVTVLIHDSKKALAKIVADHDCDRDQARTILNAWLETILQRGGQAIVDGERAVVRAGASGHERVKKELDRIVQYGFKNQIVLETRFCTISKSVFDELPLDWRLTDQGHSRQPVVLTQLDGKQFKSVVELIQADPRSNIMMAPKVTTFNGSSVSVSDIIQRPFVVSGETTKQTIRVVNDGIKLAARPIYEDGVCNLEIDMTVSDIGDVQDFSFRRSEHEKVTVQVPQVTEQRLRASASVVDGHSVAFAMPGADDPNQIFVGLLTPTQLAAEAIEPPEANDTSINQAVPATALPRATHTIAAEPVYSIADSPAVPAPSLNIASQKTLQHLTTWMMTADGSSTDPTTVRGVEEALRAFDARPKMRGDWKMERLDDELILRGSNLSIRSADRDFAVRSPSGSIRFDTDKQSIQLVSEGGSNWQVELHDLNLQLQASRFGVTDDGLRASGDPARFRLELEHEDSRMNISGQCKSFRMPGETLLLEDGVRLQFADTVCSADSVRIADVDTSRLIEFRGNVRMANPTAPEAGSNLHHLRCEYLEIDLASESLQIVR